MLERTTLAPVGRFTEKDKIIPTKKQNTEIIERAKALAEAYDLPLVEEDLIN